MIEMFKILHYVKFVPSYAFLDKNSFHYIYTQKSKCYFAYNCILFDNLHSSAYFKFFSFYFILFYVIKFNVK